MKRVRDTSWYADLTSQKREGLADALTSNIVSGHYSFHNQGEIVDFIYEERSEDSNVLLVCFSSAVGVESTVPKMEGRGLASKLGVSLLAFADPSVAASTKISTNYCLGRNDHDFFDVMRKIVHKFAKDRRIIFFGVSGGGFPALKFGDFFPESLSCVINPRVNILVGKTFFRTNKRLLFPRQSYSELDRQKALVNGRAKNHVLYIQNIGDENYFGFQMVPYIVKNEGNQKVSVILGDWGRGHKAMPGPQRSETLHALIDASNWAEGLQKVGTQVSSLRTLQAFRADLEEAAKAGIPINETRNEPATLTRLLSEARHSNPKTELGSTDGRRQNSNEEPTSVTMVKERQVDSSNLKKDKTLIIGSTKFSVYSPNSVAWKASNGSRFSNDQEYKNYLFSDERLTQRADVFLNISLPQLNLASQGFEYKHILSYSESMPEKFKRLLTSAAKTYPFLILDEVSELSKVMDPVSLAKQLLDEPGVFGLFRLDDDDILGLDYFEQISRYLADPFVGMRVSLATGFTGIWESKELSVVREVHRPMIAIGLLSVCRLESDGSIIAPKPTPHNLSDRTAPVILDGKSPSYIWLRHPSQDTELNRSAKADPIKRLKRELIQFESLRSIDEFGRQFPAVAPFVRVPKSTVLQEARIELSELDEFLFSEPLNSFEISLDLDVRPGSIPRNALLAFDLREKDGRPINSAVNAPGLSISSNPEIGHFRALTTRRGRRAISEMVVLPDQVYCWGVKILKYKKLDAEIFINRLTYHML
ncbi:hypothetical protein CFAEC_05165 [Corynebacterium faecale]|uniref:glycosyltransferase n=1 Tax=Corynebacterium faecale TaxID=1758466 RepID=UPI0025B2C7C3|nr:glycosyltransferase [Corynebacterium faecale]WJY91877.1 hypothetical protein CFAEC_05165 [Corynebacterium faecale]